jgi:hypothetical protein
VEWDRLNTSEKIQQGRRSFVGQSVVDAMTGQTVYREGGVTRIYTGGLRDYSSTETKYRATKKTANHKTLKRAGLVN